MSKFNEFLTKLERPVLPDIEDPQPDPEARTRELEAALGLEREAGQDLDARLNAIEQALKAKNKSVRKMELENYAFRICTAAGIDPDLLEGYSMENEEAIKGKVEKLAGAVAISKQDAVNLAIQQNSPKPRSGITSSKPTLTNISPAEALTLEMSGRLNDMIRGSL